nr:thiol-activated cytolysin family protein [Ramlibacter agri]
MVAFDPNAGVLFPGSLVQGKSLPDGVLFPITVVRREQTCTVTGLSGPANTRYSATFVPTASNATAAISEILAQHFNADQPARATYSETNFYSMEQATLKLGASYGWLTGKVDGSFNTANTNAVTRNMVRFVQAYYTVSCEAPSTPIDLFAWNTDYGQLRQYMGPGNPPAFVNSVTYGRELWMLIESQHSEAELNAALKAAANFGAGHMAGSVDNVSKKVLDESSIQVLAIGGSGKHAVKPMTNGAAALTDYLESGANFSIKSPGWPISYTAMYLRDNSIARVSATTDYVIKTSVADPEPAPLTSARVTWTTTGDDKDWDTQAVVDVFDKDGTNVAHVACCSSDKNSDHWTGGAQTRQLTLLRGADNMSLQHGNFRAYRNPHGTDDWDYQATVELFFADGTSKTYSNGGRNTVGQSW